jgi:hypothetical protein
VGEVLIFLEIGSRGASIPDMNTLARNACLLERAAEKESVILGIFDQENFRLRH